MQEYAVVTTKSEADKLIKLIDETKHFSGTWALPIRHPDGLAYLIPLDWNQLNGCESILEGLEHINRLEAKARGWYFGQFTGIFAREKQKMEDVHYLFDAIVVAYGKPNFPALRALILSFLSACYALQESLEGKCNRPTLKSTLGNWWAERLKEMKSKGELLHVFERYMNSEKHDQPFMGAHAIELSPTACMTELVVSHLPLNANPNSIQISAEGVFVTVYEGTPMERRFPVGVLEARYEVNVDNPPASHLGKPIHGLTLLMMIETIRDYYANLLFNATCLIGEGP